MAKPGDGKGRLAAVMFADIVGLNELAQKDRELGERLANRYLEIQGPRATEHNGQVISHSLSESGKTGLRSWLGGPQTRAGDAASQIGEFVLEFRDTLDALRSAVDIQRDVRDHNRGVATREELSVRIGIHLGEIIGKGKGVGGEGLNVASQLALLAQPGEIRISEQVFNVTRDKLDLSASNLGKTSLRNIKLPVDVYRVTLPWEEQLSSNLGSLARDRKRVAVLPLVSLSPDPNDEYFADGMTEEVISTISKIEEIEVISRTSVMTYKKTPKPVKELSKELDVGTVLEGSVRKAGNKLRVTVQMIDARRDKHLWANSYDRELRDVFAIQTDIAEHVAGALKVQLLSTDRQKIEKKPTESGEAYALYLRGRHHWNERTEKEIKEAINHFEQATKIDPEFARAYSGLADCYLIIAERGWSSPKQALLQAKNYADRALELDQELAEAHATQGLLSMSNLSLGTAERHLKRAIELNPHYAMAYHWLSLLLRYTRRNEEAYETEKIGYRLDPFLLIHTIGIGQCLLYLGKNDQAIEQFEKATMMSPDIAAGMHWMKSTALASSGNYAGAVEEGKKAVEMEKENPVFGLDLALIYAVAGQTAKATDLLDEILLKANRVYVRLAQVAVVKMALGKEGEGFKWLERAFDEHDEGLLLLRSLPWLRRFWSDPRWVEIERKAGVA